MSDVYKNLWLAVLEQAIEDVKQDVKNQENVRAINKANALEWFSNKNEGIGSFIWICYFLEIAPGPIRRIALNNFEYF
jgi:hypothetical protein